MSIVIDGSHAHRCFDLGALINKLCGCIACTPETWSSAQHQDLAARGYDPDDLEALVMADEVPPGDLEEEDSLMTYYTQLLVRPGSIGLMPADGRSGIGRQWRRGSS